MSKKQANKDLHDLQSMQAAKAVNLRDQLIRLPKVMQEAIANYFNMYNCAAWLYNEVLTPDARDYVEQSIKYARELQELESIPDSIDPEEQDKMIRRLNHGEQN